MYFPEPNYLLHWNQSHKAQSTVPLSIAGARRQKAEGKTSASPSIHAFKMS